MEEVVKLKTLAEMDKIIDEMKLNTCKIFVLPEPIAGYNKMTICKTGKDEVTIRDKQKI